MTPPITVCELMENSQSLDRSGDVAGALNFARQAVELARQLPQNGELGSALVHLGRLHFHLGHYPKAQAMAKEVLAVYDEEHPICARAWMLLGSCASETNAVAEAEQHFHQACDLARQSGDGKTRMEALHNLAASVYMLRGQFELALAADDEALAITKKLSLLELLPYPLIVIAWCNLILGRSRAARASLSDLFGAAIPGSRDQGYYYWLSGDLALYEGNTTAALADYTIGRSIAEATGDPGLNTVIRLGYSRYHRSMGEAAAALTWADDALKQAARVGYCHLQGKSLIEHGRAAWANGDRVTAEQNFREALQVLQPLQADYDLAVAQLLLAGVHHAAGDPRADETWREAIQRIQRGNFSYLLDQERALVYPVLSAYMNETHGDLSALSAALVERLQRQPTLPLSIATFGGLRVQRGAQELSPKAFRQRRAGELFAFLLLAPNRCAAVEQACEAIWPDKEPRSCQALFHQATSSLRRALEPDLPEKFPSHYLQVEDGMISLNLPPESRVDFDTFTELSKAQAWSAALALYNGDLLPEYLYTDWSTAPRLRFAQIYQRGLLILAEEALSQGSYTRALDTCQDLLAIDPWHEQAVLIGMQACLGLNDSSSALRLYCSLEKTLQSELNISPQKELQTLYALILTRRKSSTH